MSKSSPQHDERLSEELVAYLDGELSTAESESVEARIRQDEQARSELQKFDRVWNALDDLQPVTVDESFTRTTIEMAAVEAKKELAHETAMLPVRRRNRWLKIASLATVAALVGFVALATLMPNPNRQLYGNLPVIMELDAYSEVRDIDFLRLLNAESSDWLLAEWGDDVAQRAEAVSAMTSSSFGERRRYVDGLNTDARADLASKHRRYQNLTPETRDELAAWHTRLATDPNAAELQEVMLAYYAWVSQEDEIDQARLRSLDAQARVDLVEEMQRRAERRSEMLLSPTNVAALRRAFNSMADDPKMQKLHSQAVRASEALEKSPFSDQAGRKHIESMRRLAAANPQLAMRLIIMASGAGRLQNPMGPITDYRDEIEKRLIQALDDSTTERLRSMPERQRRRQLAIWQMVAMRGPRNPDVATLEEYFVSGNLSPDVQQRLLAMPKDQMLHLLEEMYIHDFLGDSEGDRELQQFMRDVFMRGRFGRGRWGDRDIHRPDERGPRGPGGPPGVRPRREGQRGPGPPPGDRPGPPRGNRSPI